MQQEGDAAHFDQTAEPWLGLTFLFAGGTFLHVAMSHGLPHHEHAPDLPAQPPRRRSSDSEGTVGSRATASQRSPSADDVEAEPLINPRGSQRADLSPRSAFEPVTVTPSSTRPRALGTGVQPPRPSEWWVAFAKSETGITLLGICVPVLVSALAGGED